MTIQGKSKKKENQREGQACDSTNILFFVFNWRIIALQHCVGLCHTSTWIGHIHIHIHSYTYVPPSRGAPPPPSPTPSHPSKLSENTRLSSLCHTANSHLLSILHIVMYTFPCYFLSLSHPFLPLLWPQVCSLCQHLHCSPANRFISTIILDSIHMR